MANTRATRASTRVAAKPDAAADASQDAKPAPKTKTAAAKTKAPASKTKASASKAKTPAAKSAPAAAEDDAEDDADDAAEDAADDAADDAAPTPAPAVSAGPKTSKPLKGCAVALTGSFASVGHNLTSMKILAKELGGMVTSSITQSTTHIVCSSNESSKRMHTSVAMKIPLMKPEWVVECGKQKRHIPESEHLWDLSQTSGDGVTGKQTTVTSMDVLAMSVAGGALNGATEDDAPSSNSVNANKRGRGATTSDGEKDEEEQKPQTKKAKLASRSKAKDPEPDVKEEEEEAAAKIEDKDEGEEEEAVAEGQFAKKKNIVIPVDEFYPSPGYQVYVDQATGMIYDASLNQSNATANNNKFYRDQVVFNPKTKSFKTWTRWGRVGDVGQKAELGDGSLADAVKVFEKKFKDKSGLAWDNRGADPKPGKYAFVERSYNPDSDDEDDTDAKSKVKKEAGEEEDEEEVIAPSCTLEKPIMELVQLIFNQKFFNNTMAAMNYDANKLPLGKLSKNTILRGFQQLKDLSALFDDPTLAQSKWDLPIGPATEHLSNTYYSLIPHDFGRNRPPVISDNTMLKKEVELLESLSDMKDAADIMKIDRKKKGPAVHPLDLQYKGLGMEEMTTLDHKSQEFSLLETYLHGSRGATHRVNYSVLDIWRIERPGEHTRFNASSFAKIDSDRRLLWHGSRCTNFGGILSQGLRIAPPEAPVNGYMFGKGIYLADMSSKSAGYCCSHDSGGQALLLLCDAELGSPMQRLTGASYDAGQTAKKNGQAATHGLGRVGPSKWVDAGPVHKSLEGVKMPDPEGTPGDTGSGNVSLYYNEYIAYDVAQVRLRYLFRVKM